MVKIKILVGIAVLESMFLVGAFAQSMTVESAKRTYQATLENALTKKKQAVERAEVDYSKTVEVAREQMKRTYETVIRQAAMRNDTKTVAAYVKELELLNSGASTVSVDKSIPEIEGVWVRSEPLSKSEYLFEFKKNGQAVQTQKFQGADETIRTQITNYRYQKKADRIVLNIDSEGDHQYRTSYEVVLPIEGGRILVIETLNYDGGHNKNERYYVKAEDSGL